MDSRRGPASEDAREAMLSRRSLLAATPSAFGCRSTATAQTAVPLSGGHAPSDEVSRLKRWLTLDALIEKYQELWARLESRLARERGWLELSSAQQKERPEFESLAEIDDQLACLTGERDAVAIAVPASRRMSIEAIFMRLAVAERLVWPDDHPEAHELIASARRDLGRLAGLFR